MVQIPSCRYHHVCRYGIQLHAWCHGVVVGSIVQEVAVSMEGKTITHLAYSCCRRSRHSHWRPPTPHEKDNLSVKNKCMMLNLCNTRRRSAHRSINANGLAPTSQHDLYHGLQRFEPSHQYLKTPPKRIAEKHARIRPENRVSERTCRCEPCCMRTRSPGATISGLIRLSVVGPYELKYAIVSMSAGSAEPEGSPDSGLSLI